MEKQQKAYVKSERKWKQFSVLRKETLEALDEAQYFQPTFVQGRLMEYYQEMQKEPFILTISSMNGSGKTLCMLVPAINSVDTKLPVEAENKKGKKVRLPQVLMAMPTIGLIEQTSGYLSNFSKTFANFKEGFLIRNKVADSSPSHIELGTAQSLAKAIEDNSVSLSNLRFLLLDEFDQLLNSNKSAVTFLLEEVLLNSQAKVILASATLANEKDFLKKLISSKKITRKILTIDTNKELGQINLKGVKQYFYKVGPEAQREEVVLEVLKFYEKQPPVGQVLVFFNTIKEVNQFNDRIRKEGIKLKVGLFHGDLQQLEKREMVGKIRNRSFELVLATNIMARGLDIRTITLVISVKPPTLGSPKNPSPIEIPIYVHRVGRTGRYSDKGVSLVVVKEGAKMGPELETDLPKKLKDFNGCNVQELKKWEQLYEEMKIAFQNNQKEQ